MSVVFISSDCVSRDEVPVRDAPQQEDSELAVPLGLLNLATILRGRRGRNVILTALRPCPESGSIRPIAELVDEVLAQDPDWVGISTRCDTYPSSLRAAQEFKRRRPGLPIVLGGPQATATAQATLRAFAFVDVIARGEAETIIEQLDDALGGGASVADIPSLVYRRGGSITSTPALASPVDLDSLPFPDYAMFPWLNRVQRIPIDAGRGCPFHCTYCSTSRFFANRYRLRSTDGLLALIQWTVNSTGRRTLQFTHDNLTANPRKFEEFCTALRDARLGVEWKCSARLDCLTPARLELMRQAGCSAIYIGLETGSATLQREIQKNLDLRDVQARLRHVAARIPGFTTSFMVGFPAETASDLAATADLMADVREIGEGRETVQLHMLSPTPGTPIFQQWSANLRLLTGREGMAADAELEDFVAVKGADESSLDWVRSHPELFGNFYYLEGQHLSRALQVAFCTVLRILHASYPNTARLMHSGASEGEPVAPLIAATLLAQQWTERPWPSSEGDERVLRALTEALTRSRSPKARRTLDALRVEAAVNQLRRGQARRLTVRTTWDVAMWLHRSGSRESAWSAAAVACCILISRVDGPRPLIARVPPQVADFIERAASIARLVPAPPRDGEQRPEAVAPMPAGEG